MLFWVGGFSSTLALKERKITYKLQSSKILRPLGNGGEQNFTSKNPKHFYLPTIFNIAPNFH